MRTGTWPAWALFCVTLTVAAAQGSPDVPPAAEESTADPNLVADAEFFEAVSYDAAIQSWLTRQLAEDAADPFGDRLPVRSGQARTACHRR